MKILPAAQAIEDLNSLRAYNSKTLCAARTVVLHIMHIIEQLIPQIRKWAPQPSSSSPKAPLLP
jgi:hypothetical protein